MSSHNKELRQQQIRETEQATPDVHLRHIHMVGPDKDIDHFADTFLRKKTHNPRKKRVWNNRYNLRIAYKRIEDWKTHYHVTDISLTEKPKKISFVL